MLQDRSVPVSFSTHTGIMMVSGDTVLHTALVYDGQPLHLVPLDLLRCWRENTACSRECCRTRQEKLTGPRAKKELTGARLVARGVLPPPSFSRCAAQGLSRFYGASSASAGPHYGARCWCTTMSQCVQLRREIYGRGCLLPTPSRTQRFLQVPYQTRLREASDWLLTEQAHGGVRQV